jgi:Ni,Fe-hydrogenase III small subunit/Pyruvate/2-oxoacid:ferredoxin oxidoreductase delta subunit
MKDALKIRILQGDPVVHDVHQAQLSPLFRGLPLLDEQKCQAGCAKCVENCPTGAVSTHPLKIDLGLCVFCPICEEICPGKAIRYSGNYQLAASAKEQLLVTQAVTRITPEKASAKIRKYFGRSLKLRQVSAGGCNGCELELNALGNVNFDMGRFGIEFTASPRHADGLVLTGPLTLAMKRATEICDEAIPRPRVVILFGACAISGGIFKKSTQIDRTYIDDSRIDLFFPGCPPHPLTFITGLLAWLDKK